MEATVRLDHELLAVEGEHEVHVMLELAAPDADERRGRAPLRLALVIDRSGSMAGGKLRAAKAAARYLGRRLTPDDRLAVIAYDHEVDLLVPLGAVDPAAAARIEGLTARGSTNLSGGWLKGIEELGRVEGDGVRKVLLLTDGLANAGITDPDRLVELAASRAAAGTGTTTIGFGQGFNEELLTAVAAAGSGNAHYAATAEEVPGIFAAEFDDLASLVAQNLSVEVRPAEGVDIAEVLNEYRTTGVTGGLQVQVGDLYAAERRRLVARLAVPEIARLGVAEVARLVVRYVSVGDAVAAHELALPVVVNLVSATDAALAQGDHEVVEEVTVLQAARANDEARRRLADGDVAGAREVLEMAAERLRQAAADSERAQELFDQAARLRESSAMAVQEPSAMKRLRYDARNQNLRKRGGNR